MLTSPHFFPTPEMSLAPPSHFSQLLAQRLRIVRERIATTAVRFGRDPNSVTLLAVSKQQSSDAIRAVAALGQSEFGENYLQEALEKMAEVELPLTWHFIGQVQSNKTRPIAEHFAWAHTIDRVKIAQRLNEQRPSHLPPLNVCIQVKLAEEAAKGGIEPAGVIALAHEVAQLPRLRLRGLMCIPPPRATFDEQFAFFKAAADLQLELRAARFDVDTLSMGMSGDLDAAIAAGATIVRVGTGIFGDRIYRDARRGTRDPSE